MWLVAQKKASGLGGIEQPISAAREALRNPRNGRAMCCAVLPAGAPDADAILVNCPIEAAGGWRDAECYHNRSLLASP